MGGTLFLEAINIVLAAIPEPTAHTKQVMLVALGMNVINIALNAVLIFGLLDFIGLPALVWLVRRFQPSSVVRWLAWLILC